MTWLLAERERAARTILRCDALLRQADCDNDHDCQWEASQHPDGELGRCRLSPAHRNELVDAFADRAAMPMVSAMPMTPTMDTPMLPMRFMGGGREGAEEKEEMNDEGEEAWMPPPPAFYRQVGYTKPGGAA